jgi:hypothetical protein
MSPLGKTACLLLLTTVIFTSGCTSQTEKLSSPENALAAQVKTARPKSNQTAYTDATLSKQTALLDLKAVYPQWVSAPEESQLVKQAVETHVDVNDTHESDTSGKLTEEVSYKVLTNTPELISILFSTYFYMEGAAHPNTTSMTLNLDRRTHKQLSLQEIFLPDKPYLESLSTLAHQQLIKELPADGLFEEGLKPVSDNFRSWNLTPQGLQINFDPYQVAPYAAGPQEVLIPYKELQGLIRPELIDRIRQK